MALINNLKQGNDKLEKNLTEAIGPEEAAKYRDTEVNLYKEYYPDDAPVMKALAETDPQTKKALLEKSLNDLLLEKQVDVSPIVDADANLKSSIRYFC